MSQIPNRKRATRLRRFRPRIEQLEDRRLLSAAADAGADLQVGILASPASELVGDTVAETATVHNAGPQTATNVVVNFTFPANFNFTSFDATQGFQPGDGDVNNFDGTVTFHAASLAAGSDLVVTLDATPAQPGTYTVPVTATSDVADPTAADDSAIASTTAQKFTISGANVLASEGLPFQDGTVATFTDSNPNSVATDFTATIVWGDGSTSSGNVQGSNGSFAVTGTHTYQSDGSSMSGGYWLVASDGGIFPFGDARGFGSTGAIKLNKPIVGMEATPDGGGYWLVASDGGIFPFGDARGFGSTGAIKLNKPIVGMEATPDGGGYWLVASDGGIFPFGDARGFGSTGAIKLNKPIVGMEATPDGGGYWLVASDGGIFPFGDARGFGSTGAIKLNKPIVGMEATPDGGGYWLVASDGGIFPFGDAGSLGSTGGIKLNKPIVGMEATPDGGGYWLVASDGGIFPFGDAQGFGSPGNVKLKKPIVGMEKVPPAFSRMLVTVHAAGGSSASTFDQVTVSAHAPIASITGPSQGLTGQQLPFTVQVATPLPADQTAGFTYTIDWNDGTPQRPDRQVILATSFNDTGVQVSHVYLQSGSYTPQVIATDNDNESGPAGTLSPGIVVITQELRMSGVTVSATQGRPFQDGTVATFTDNNPNSAATDFTATIDWGDGSTSDGNVQGSEGSYAVTGTHTYQVNGSSMAGGYWLVGSDGGIFPFGDAGGFGSTGARRLNKPIVGMESTPDGGGYWLVASDGGIFPFGDAEGFGSLGNIKLNKPIVGMEATPDGGGYWLVASDGGIFPVGDAPGFGSLGNVKLKRPIVGMEATPDGRGYWLVASDGGVFPFGDARAFGGLGGTKLNKPIVGMEATPDGAGYWLVASDGGVFPFGDAGGFGSTGGMKLNKPIVGMEATPDGGGYWLVASDGGIFPFGDAPGLGSLGNAKLNKPIVGMERLPPKVSPILVTIHAASGRTASTFDPVTVNARGNFAVTAVNAANLQALLTSQRFVGLQLNNMSDAQRIASAVGLSSPANDAALGALLAEWASDGGNGTDWPTLSTIPGDGGKEPLVARDAHNVVFGTLSNGVLGLRDLGTTSDDVMDGLLGVGVRRNASHIDAVLASM